MRFFVGWASFSFPLIFLWYLCTQRIVNASGQDVKLEQLKIIADQGHPSKVWIADLKIHNTINTIRRFALEVNNSTSTSDNNSTNNGTIIIIVAIAVVLFIALVIMLCTYNQAAATKQQKVSPEDANQRIDKIATSDRKSGDIEDQLVSRSITTKPTQTEVDCMTNFAEHVQQQPRHAQQDSQSHRNLSDPIPQDPLHSSQTLPAGTQAPWRSAQKSPKRNSAEQSTNIPIEKEVRPRSERMKPLAQTAHNSSVQGNITMSATNTDRAQANQTVTNETSVDAAAGNQKVSKQSKQAASDSSKAAGNQVSNKRSTSGDNDKSNKSSNKNGNKTSKNNSNDSNETLDPEQQRIHSRNAQQAALKRHQQQQQIYINSHYHNEAADEIVDHSNNSSEAGINGSGRKTRENSVNKAYIGDDFDAAEEFRTMFQLDYALNYWVQKSSQKNSTSRNSYNSNNYNSNTHSNLHSNISDSFYN